MLGKKEEGIGIRERREGNKGERWKRA